MSGPYKFKEFMKEPSLKNLCRFFGENPNGAITVTVALSTCKGIFRPIFTLKDKKQDPESKKYAAIREFLTEVIAVPLYIAIPFYTGKLVEKVLKTDNVNQNKRMETNAKFIGVCLAALAIPFVCNIVQPPIMEAIKKRAAEKKAKKGLDVTSAADVQTPTVIAKPVTPVNSSLYKTFPVSNAGMRVGN